ncbi:hypothetical protein CAUPRSCDRAFT_217, partial [Caulochytrium protostelioides]
IVCAMATCHSLSLVDDELIGDPLDLKMFEFTGWSIAADNAMTLAPIRPRGHGKARDHIVASATPMIVKPPTVHFSQLRPGLLPEAPKVELAVLRSFDFVSNLRRMSVIVRRVQKVGGVASDDTGEGYAMANRWFECFVKGAPEVMRQICSPASLPADYDAQLRAYAHHGYRIIACAWKRINMSTSKVYKLKRDAVENDCSFLGFIVFENKLKATTPAVVRSLRRAKIRQAMCTGDNVLTGLSVSRECGLVNPSSRIFVPRFLSPDDDCPQSIMWEDVDGSGVRLDPLTLMPIPATAHQPRHEDSGLDPPLFAPGSTGQYELAVTGEVFQHYLDYASEQTLARLLVKAQIFARMSPDQKHFLVERLQGLGYTVGFCGDGANDCGALKAADVGISLSEAEASVAAPLTSHSTDLECVLTTIREGRAALVTSFSCFKYMALYSLIQFTSVSLLYSQVSNLGDFQFLYIDLAIIIPVAVFMGQAEAAQTVSLKGPTATLVSKKILTSLFGQIAIQAALQVALFRWTHLQPWYAPPATDIDEKGFRSYDNTVVFLLSAFQYLIVALVFNAGRPFRAPAWRNRPFILTLGALALFNIWLTLAPSPWIRDLLELMDLPPVARFVILAAAAVDLALTWGAEEVLLPSIARAWGRLMHAKARHHAR